MKYYVESGNVKVVITAPDELAACVRALQVSIKERQLSVEFEDMFMVSQSGFIGERNPFTMTVPEEVVIDAEEVIDEYGKRF
mgnify:FL=1|tara:strand:+ start:992 stop:1237 length:246 start_codon:yes stop_codon:yes gene_type:complete